MLECVNDWSKLLDKKYTLDIVYIDFAKAFDSVVHSKLLIKLQSYGITGDLFKWLRAFLTDRTQRIVVDNQCSNYKSVISGTPQGSILGPVLFVIFINDLPDTVPNSVSCKLYADDVKLYASSNNSRSLAQSLSNISTWSNKWQLTIAAQKCFVLHLGYSNPKKQYTLNNIILPLNGDCRDLGITVCSNLKFSKYCHQQVTKAFNTINLIFRCFHTNDKKSLINAYKSYIRPLVEYCTQIWSPYKMGDIDIVERVQRYFTRRLYIKCGIPYTNYLNRLKTCQLEPLEVRRLKFDVKLVYQICHDLVDVNFDDFFKYARHYPVLRGHQYKLFVPYSRVDIRKYFFANRVINIWNSLDNSIVCAANLSMFSAKLDKVDFLKYCFFNRTLTY